MRLFQPQATRQWELANHEQGNLCRQCLSLFSSLASLDLLLGEGLPISVKTFFVKSPPSCPMCLRIRQVFRGNDWIHQFMRRAPFHDGLDKSPDFRLVAECELDDLPMDTPTNVQRTILSIKYLFLTHPIPNLCSNMRLLAIYKSVDVPPEKTLRSPAFPQGMDMACDEFMAKAKLTLNECMSSHPKCQDHRASETPFLPTRVINVGVDDNDSVRIYTPKALEREHYVALSYVWGKEGQPMTNKANIERFQLQGIPLDQVAQSTKDAVKVTRKLGLRYLWVDAVCIVQDDEDDKIHELQAMGGIYQNATLTISASHSQSALEGFTTCSPPTGCQLPFLLPDGTMGSVTAVPAQIEFGRIITRPIDQRGWTFQERILSKRLLIFDYGEFKWRCATYPKADERRAPTDRISPMENINMREHSERSVTSSSMTTPFDPESEYTLPLTPLAFDDDGLILDSVCAQRSILSDQRDPEGRVELWRHLVEEYSKRIFTQNKDRLPAIAGLIEALEMTWDDKCIVGIWLSRLVEGLFWRRGLDFHGVDENDFNDNEEYNPQTQRSTDIKILSMLKTLQSSKTRRWEWWEKEVWKADRTQTREMRERSSHKWKRSELYLGPSWSWLSVSSPVSFEDIVPRASVIDYDVEPVDQRVPLHNVKAASLRLQAKVLDAPSSTFIVAEIFDEDDTELPPREERSYVRLGLEPQYEIADRWVDDADKRLSKSAMGLIVTRVEASGECKRLGIFKPSHQTAAEMPEPPHWVDVVTNKAPSAISYTYDSKALVDEERKRAIEWENAKEREITIV